MDVIERKRNRIPNVRAMNKVSSRQRTGSAFQVYGAMRSVNVKSQLLVRHDNSSMSI
jgi:hypothetical protein